MNELLVSSEHNLFVINESLNSCHGKTHGFLCIGGKSVNNGLLGLFLDIWAIMGIKLSHC